MICCKDDIWDSFHFSRTDLSLYSTVRAFEEPRSLPILRAIYKQILQKHSFMRGYKAIVSVLHDEEAKYVIEGLKERFLLPFHHGYFLPYRSNRGTSLLSPPVWGVSQYCL